MPPIWSSNNGNILSIYNILLSNVLKSVGKLHSYASFGSGVAGGACKCVQFISKMNFKIFT